MVKSMLYRYLHEMELGSKSKLTLRLRTKRLRFAFNQKVPRSLLSKNYCAYLWFYLYQTRDLVRDLNPLGSLLGESTSGKFAKRVCVTEQAATTNEGMFIFIKGCQLLSPVHGWN